MMSQRDEIKALRAEVAELRKQITALLDVERIMAQQPRYVMYPAPTLPSYPTYLWITYSSDSSGTSLLKGT